MVERRTGRLSKWRGSFGFILYNDQEIFAHLSNFYPGHNPEINQLLIFEVGPAAKQGKPNEAYRIRIVKTADQVLADFNRTGAGLNTLDALKESPSTDGRGE